MRIELALGDSAGSMSRISSDSMRDELAMTSAQKVSAAAKIRAVASALAASLRPKPPI